MTDIEARLRKALDSCHCPQPTEPTPCDGWLQHRRCDALDGALAALVQGMVTAERTRAVDLAAFFIPSGEKPDIDLLATLRATLAEQAREIETLKADLQVAHDIGDSFWLAIKPLNLPRINVSNPGAHVTELIREIERLTVALHDLVEDVKNDAQGRALVLGIDSPSMRTARAALRVMPEAGG